MKQNKLLLILDYKINFFNIYYGILNYINYVKMNKYFLNIYNYHVYNIYKIQYIIKILLHQKIY